MKQEITRDIKLVITSALKKEVPRDWLMSRQVPVMTLQALKSGAMGTLRSDSRGIMVVITGPGPEASKEAAQWISENLRPLFVVNIGTCGMIDRRYPLGQWIVPETIMNEDGEEIKNDTRIPFPLTEQVNLVPFLLSVQKAKNMKSINTVPSCSAVDMESFAQAEVFAGCDTMFHCIKMGTDCSDENMHADFNSNLDLFTESFRRLFSFIEEKKSRISVIIPVYNRRERVSHAIDSVLNQSLSPDEVIVVNDCSTDNTSDILEKYGDSITVLNLPVNSGPSVARNAGVKHAKTVWLSFLDSDDCWSRDKLKKQMAYLRNYPFYEIIQSEEVWIRNSVRVNQCNHHKKPEGWIWEPSLHRCLVSPSGVLMKKSLFEHYGGFNEILPVCEDYDLWLKISRHHPVGLERGLSVTKYGGHNDQLSRKYPAMDRFRVKSLLAHLAEEEDGEYRKKIVTILNAKLAILLSGYEKRNKQSDVDECRKILHSLNSA